jgi:hypothetical protein
MRWLPKGAHLRIVRWIEVQQGEAFNLRGDVEDVRVDRIDTPILRQTRPAGIEFDGVAIGVGVLRELDERSPCSGAWVQY